ncbi:SPOR domain-containing protein [Spirulina sp. 06S082]|uniref:SPOR domain-containing protein n=1 Tax=Spirulina sp. 06S082 TaxID=3110248 RepID=UPI002B1F5CAE|nr:SPOR domain-containing protein [Spirulina sp. 06S082]MEA5469547.1 SPOR domain-containing protein [Spirulina sp. 06S082]
MSQNTKTESTTTPNLSPVLEGALSCLDVQIEAELARYRKGRSQQPDRAGTSPQVSYPQPPKPGMAVLPVVEQKGVAEGQTSASKAIDNQIADFTQKSTANDAETQGGVSAGSDTEAPQEYLASSEELLRNVATAEAQQPVEKRKGFADRLLTPMGVGSVLVLGTAMTLLGVTLLYPDLLTRLAGEENSDAETTAIAPETPKPSPTTTPSSSPLNLTGPNLATDEFEPVNPDSLSTVDTNPDSAPSPTLPTPEAGSSPANPSTETPSSPGGASDLTTALLSPNLQSPEPPVEATPTPSPSPSPESPDPVVENAPGAPGRGDRFHYVIVDYEGGISLQQARAIVSESYVRNFPQGAQIQMGAFSSEKDAQSLVSRLEQQGIKATVYRRQ